MKNKHCKIHDDYSQCVNMLIKEIDRKDNKILEIPTDKLEETYSCSIDLIKKLIIRLRRAMPAGTISHSYGLNQYAKNDWNLFDKIIKRDIDDICLHLDDRWIMAILDTYVDYGTNDECKNAMLGVLFIRMERIFLTEQFAFRGIDVKNRKGKIKKDTIIRRERITGWDKIKSTQMLVDDFYPNFFYRLIETMQDTPEIYKMNKKIMLNAINSSNSSIGLICSISSWIRKQILGKIR